MKLEPVATPADVAANIVTFTEELPKSPALQERLGQFHAWYALKTASGWKFGPSKFVGYRQNSTSAYLKNYRAPADGRRTELVLEAWFAPVDSESRQGRELFDALAGFLGQWNRRPRAKVRIAVVSERDDDTPATDSSLLTRILVDPAVTGGRPVIKGTRMRVVDIVEMLAGGATRQEILKDFPYLSDQDISAALLYAARSADHRVVRVA